MVMSVWPGMADAALRERLPALWRRIEDSHYSYLETEDSPEKLEQRKKLEGYILEYLSLVPHECKFGLAETGKVFARTVAELPEYTACRAGLGWAALARYAANLLVQPWRVEYKTLRLYSGFYKHEVEANMVGAESLLSALGYRSAGAGRVALSQPVCPDMVAAMSRDAIIAQTECQIMSTVWESVWAGGGRVSWAEVYAERAARPGGPRDTAKALQERCRRRDAGQESNGSEIYSNIPVPVMEMQYGNSGHGYAFSPLEEPIAAVMPQYVMPAPNVLPPHMMYPTTHHMPEAAMPTVPQVTVPQMVMTPYGVPYYYPVQAPYMVPAPAYAPIKHATTVPLNGYPTLPQYRYPIVPTGQLIELDSPYENGKEDRHKRRESRRNSTSKSGFSDVSLPSLPRSDTQPALSKAREDGMGTYESWDYVFRNLSSKDEENERSRYSPSLERDSRTLDRLDREERRVKYQPTTLDLEDGLQALNLDRSYDEDLYRTAKVNENLMRLKQEQEQKKARQLRRAARDAEARRRVEPVPHPKADALIPTKVAPDKVKLLTKKDIKDRKDVIKQTVNGATPAPSAAEARKVKKPAKLVADDRPRQENGHSAQTSKGTSGPTPSPQPNHELKAQLVVSLDEPDTRRPSSRQNGERDEKPSDTHEVSKWHCATCTYLNRGSQQACEMCGKSKRGPEIQPLTSGGRECPACTLVNQREARACDACGTSLQHCPTYI